jgi:hypothetical protein
MRYDAAERTLYAASGRLIPFNSNSPTGSTVTAFSTFVSTRELMRICAPVMDVVVWLRSLGLGKYEATFRENDALFL